MKKNGPKKINFLFLQKNCLRPGDIINVIGTEILRSVAEIMDREFKKNGPKKINFLFYRKLSKAWGPHKCHRTEILRSVPEIMDREFEKNGANKINFLFL